MQQAPSPYGASELNRHLLGSSANAIFVAIEAKAADKSKFSH